MPIFDPARWNTTRVRRANNCYNYALNRIDHLFLHPGELSGGGKLGIPERFNGPLVAFLAERDGLRRIASPSFAAADEWPIALAVAPHQMRLPGGDFHWYRRDDGGSPSWSHKPGMSAIMNVDELGLPIVDPTVCHRGPYIHFVGYFAVKRVP